MKVRLLFFGLLTDVVKNNNMDIESSLFSDTDGLKNYLNQTYPGLKRFKYLLAVNQDIVRENTQVNAGDEIALLPPFSGG